MHELPAQNSRMRVAAVMFVSTLVWGSGAPRARAWADPGKPPSIEDYATIEAYCRGVPIYSFGDITYVYGISPDLLPGVCMQEGNTHPAIKIKPKKSWEISDNLCGAEPGEFANRTMWNDDQPLLPIHLIDGDPETAWCSFGSMVADARPEWVRIDLPAESTISSVALVCSAKAPTNTGTCYGKVLPRELAIKVSKDAWHWETVYERTALVVPPKMASSTSGVHSDTVNPSTRSVL